MKNKNVFMAIIFAVALIMTSAYAAFASRLTISGTATIANTWDVKIMGISVGNKSTTAAGGTPTFTSTTATFAASLKQPGDYVEYVVTVKNNGNLDATLNTIVIAPANAEGDLVTYAVTGVTEEDDLLTGATHTVTVRAEFDSSVSEQPTEEQVSKAVSITLNYAKKQ